MTSDDQVLRKNHTLSAENVSSEASNLKANIPHDEKVQIFIGINLFDRGIDLPHDRSR